MKNTTIKELTIYEIGNVAGGMEWRIPWDYAKLIVAVSKSYRYEELKTYQAVVKEIENFNNNKLEWKEAAMNIGEGLYNDVFDFSFTFLGLRTLFNTVIPFIVIKLGKLAGR